MEVYTQCWVRNLMFPCLTLVPECSQGEAGSLASESDCCPDASPAFSPAAARTDRLSSRSPCAFKSDWKLKPGHLFCRTQYRVDTHVMLKSYQLLKMSFLVKCHRNQGPRVSFKKYCHTYGFHKLRLNSILNI